MRSTGISRSIKPSAFLFDLDGTLYGHGGPIPGAAETISNLRRRGFPLRFLTNTTRSCRRTILERMRAFGFEVEDEELFSPAVAVSRIFEEFQVKTVAAFIEQEVFEDFRDLKMVGGTSGNAPGLQPDAVLLGDLGDGWTNTLLNEALRYLLKGARFVALQKGRFWQGPSGLEVDAGAYVAALEHASGRDALICGKPNAEFFRTALHGIRWDQMGGLPVMVGDDLTNDIQGSQQVGWEGWLVLTGKTDQAMLEAARVEPDRVLKSVNQILDLV